jgi:hypothetical protein
MTPTCVLPVSHTCVCVVGVVFYGLFDFLHVLDGGRFDPPLPSIVADDDDIGEAQEHYGVLVHQTVY